MVFMGRNMRWPSAGYQGVVRRVLTAELPGEFLLAGLSVKVGAGKFEPRPEAKGDVARAYLYMDQAYPGLGIVSGKNRKLFAAWSKMDPVDDWECERAGRIAAAQGRTNAVVEAECARSQRQSGAG